MRRSSAEKVAFLRALGALEEDPCLRNPDSMARDFLADISASRISLGLAARRSALHACGRWAFERIVPGVYWAEIARVKHFDQILLEEVSAGVGQVVILGAGLDSRAYRLSSELAGIGLFEVDHPVTASRKCERLRAIFGELPSHVSYVSADLTEGAPGEALAATGFDPGSPVLILWVGVVPYLSAEVVADLLRWVSSHPSTSSVAFDYYDRAFFDRARRMRGASRVRRMIERSGERFVSGFDPDAIPELLADRGLTVRTHLGPREQEDRYLRGSDDEVAGRPIDYANFVHAGVLAT